MKDVGWSVHDSVLNEGGGTMADSKVLNASDFPSLQAAVDALPREGGEVFLPAGLYVLATDLVIGKPNVVLRGAESGGTIIQSSQMNEARAVIDVRRAGFCAKWLELEC